MGGEVSVSSTSSSLDPPIIPLFLGIDTTMNEQRTIDGREKLQAEVVELTYSASDEIAWLAPSFQFAVLPRTNTTSERAGRFIQNGPSTLTM